MRANAFAIGALAHGVAKSGDRFGLMLSQPLRVHRAKADLTLPISRDAGGNVQHQTRRVDVAPKGRETTLQVAYGLDLGGLERRRVFSVDGFAALTLQPGHDSTSTPTFGTGVRIRLAF